MDVTYGVVWREGSGPLARGKLELRPRVLHLDGMAAARPVAHAIAYDELEQVRVGRAPAERLDGRPSLVLERRAADRIAIASVAQPGVIGELAERLTSLKSAGMGRRTSVIVPLVDGAYDAVRRLLDEGPPFDPEQIGLARHDVFITPSEVVLVFEAASSEGGLESLLAEPALWASAHAWSEYLAGPPRIAETAYAWTHLGVVDPSLLPPGLRDSPGR